MKTTKYETIFKKERIKTMVECYSRVVLEILKQLYFIREASRRDLDYLFINHDKYSYQIFDDAEIVFTDGKPILWMAQWLKRPIVEKVSGPDLMLLLCERAAKKNYKIFLLG